MRIIKTGVALALLLGVSVAHAAGLGKLTVHSALGQPLHAEIDLVSVQQGELDGLNARISSPEAFRDARIEYSPALRHLRFSVEKRANGQPYLKVTSAAPINEPFLDALIELSWPQGRIQREYPILLDPPGYGQGRVAAPAVAAAPAPSAAPQTPPASAPAASSPPPASTEAPRTEPGGTPSASAELPRTPSTAPAESTAGGDTYGPVQKGDTLAKIANELKPSNVSLEQMLVALYRENKSAFVNNNMNRLKAGQILKVPSANEVEQLESKEANREYRTHVADWKAYREQLGTAVAAAPARPESSTPAASSGRIASAAVTPPAAPSAPPKDVLKLSKTDASGKAGASGKGGGSGATQERLNALQEELTAKDKALAEANSRVADLEKQIRDMQRLIDLKGAAPKTDPKVAAVPAAPVKAPEPPKPEPAKPADTKLATAPPTPAAPPGKAPEPAKVEPAKPAEPAKAAEPPKVAQATPTPTPTPAPTAPKAADPAKPAPKVDPAKPAAKKPPPPPAKSFTDELLDNPLVFWGGIGLLTLALAGGAFAFVRKRRGDRYAGTASSIGGGSAFPADLKVDQTPGKPGGGLVDTGNSSFLTDFDKTGPGTIDTDEVDPVAEAEVYIAYGRDAQAEEILKEAMARDRNRPEIAVKLLEIYHARKSATAFETVAKELHGQVGDSHPLWQKAAAMGAQIDPRNPLYAGAAVVGAGAFSAASTPVEKPDVDFDIAGSKGGEPASSPDINLGDDTSKSTETASSAMDFDLNPSTPAPASQEPAAAKEDKPAFDFDLSGLDFPGSKPAGASTDLDLEASRPAPGAPALNLSDLSLDSPADTGSSAGAEGVGTKLELAKAYLEIGDKDGAREILQEVAKEGSAAQQAEAQKLISQL